MNSHKNIHMRIKSCYLQKFQTYPVLGAFIAQLISLVLIKIIIQILNHSMQITTLVFFQALFSGFITQVVLKLPKWFIYISILCPILLALGFEFMNIPSWVYGALFLFFALTFSHTLKERVPLYLTNKVTHEALKKIIDNNQAKTFVDLGSGLGGVVRAIAETQATSIGVESAPLLWSVSSLVSLLTFKGRILRQNIWNTKLGDMDVVYAFLSPAIMDKLYQKVKSEMKEGSYFVSNSFQVIGIEPDDIWQLNDKRQTRLFFYKIKK